MDRGKCCSLMSWVFTNMEASHPSTHTSCSVTTLHFITTSYSHTTILILIRFNWQQHKYNYRCSSFIHDLRIRTMLDIIGKSCFKYHSKDKN